VDYTHLHINKVKTLNVQRELILEDLFRMAKHMMVLAVRIPSY